MASMGGMMSAGRFLAMWLVMMVAMMTPSLVPMLARFRRAAPAGGALTVLAGAGYFTVWTGLGVVAYAAALAWGAAEQRWAPLAREAPLAAGLVLLAAGGVQLTRWKARRLAWCRAPVPDRAPAPGGLGALAYGLEAGVSCTACCAGFMTVLLVAGVMDLRVMAVVAAGITIERLTPWPVVAARAAGLLILVAGAVVVARGLGLA